jgi:hypothetical protein
MPWGFIPPNGPFIGPQIINTMELKPADLGERWHILLIRQRAFPPSVFQRLFPRAEEEQKVVRVGPLKRRWIKGLSGTEKAHKESLRITRKDAKGNGWVVSGLIGIPSSLATIAILAEGHGVPVMPFLLMGTGAVLSAAHGLHFGPRRRQYKLHETPLKPNEIDYLHQSVRGSKNQAFPERLVSVVIDQLGLRDELRAGMSEPDELVSTYLSLVREVLAAENLPERSQDDLRKTIKAIGETMTVLPPPAPVTTNPEEARLLVNEAERLFSRAQDERDSVIAASLARQAEALVQRASAGQNAEKLTRRTRVLRQELLAQIETVRASLPTLTQGAVLQGTSLPFAGFAQVADSVADVYREAAALANAQDELYTDMAGTVYPTARAAAYEELNNLNKRAADVDDSTQILRAGQGG